MKNTVTTLAVATVVLLTGGIATSWAKPKLPPARLTSLLKLFDADGNGKLDEEERQAAKDYLAKKYEEIVAEWDKDGDGKLSGKEIAALRAHIREKIRENRLAKFKEVAGEDELISAEEFAAMPVFAEADPVRVTRLFTGLDRNKDGQLNFLEFARSFRSHR